MRTSIQYCQEKLGQAGPYFTHFAACPEVVNLYDSGEVLQVTIEECEVCSGCYWSWWDEEKQTFQFTCYWRGGVEMCFPYGTAIEEQRGRGKLLPVRVTPTRGTYENQIL
jgi:hypothetical protein